MLDPWFSLGYNGPPFVLFAPAHGVALALVVLACVLVAWVARRVSPAAREWLRSALAWFALANGLAWQLWQVVVGIWTPAYALPLHLCTLANFLCVLMLWKRSYRLFEVLYFWGTAAVTQALLTPDIGRFGFPHFVFLIFFTSHGSIPASIAFLMAAYGFRPHWASLGRAILFTIGYMAVVGVVNWLTGGNYMFVARKPEFATPLDFLPPWPWYIPIIIALGSAAFLLVYLPFAVIDWRSHTRREASASGARNV